MSTLPQIDPATATGPAAEALTEARKALGSVPNMAKAMANSPAPLKGWLALSGALNGGVLPVAVRERIIPQPNRSTDQSKITKDRG